MSVNASLANDPPMAAAPGRPSGPCASRECFLHHNHSRQKHGAEWRRHGLVRGSSA